MTNGTLFFFFKVCSNLEEKDEHFLPFKLKLQDPQYPKLYDHKVAKILIFDGNLIAMVYSGNRT